ncbi:MAG: UDP-2,3-diacylglucosamine diphosphatase [Bacteroidota bacterium]
MSIRNKIYFASDFHLGVPDHASSLEREKRVVRWLDEVSKDASDIYLVGDLFDFWFEFKAVVPKGFTRLLGKMSEISDKGINLHVFHGNHDLWMFGYFEQEIGCKVYPKPVTVELLGKKFHIAHGDGLGPGQTFFKFILGIYRNYFFQRLFAFFHPNIGITVANWFSHRSKQQTFTEDQVYLGDDKEYLMLYAKEQVKQDDTIDYVILGHRHLPFDKKMGETHVINLGDWMRYNTYVVYDGKTVELKTYEG